MDWTTFSPERMTTYYNLGRAAIRVQRLSCIRRPDIDDRRAAIEVALDEVFFAFRGQHFDLAVALEADFSREAPHSAFDHCRF